MYVCLYVCLSVCPCLSVCLPFCVSACLPVCLSPSVCLCLSVFPSFGFVVSFSVALYVSQAVSLSVSLSLLILVSAFASACVSCCTDRLFNAILEEHSEWRLYPVCLATGCISTGRLLVRRAMCSPVRPRRLAFSTSRSERDIGGPTLISLFQRDVSLIWFSKITGTRHERFARVRGMNDLRFPQVCNVETVSSHAPRFALEVSAGV